MVKPPSKVKSRKMFFQENKKMARKIFEPCIIEQCLLYLFFYPVPKKTRQNSCLQSLVVLVVVVWKGIHSWSDTNKIGTEGLFFYYPRLLYCLDQMLALLLLSQHQVLSSKIVRPRAPCGPRYMEHAIKPWSEVCSEAPHLQFGEGARPHLCMDEWNCLTPVCRRLSLSQADWGKLIPTGLAPVLGIKTRTLKWSHSTLLSIYDFSTQKCGCQSGKVVKEIPRRWQNWESRS